MHTMDINLGELTKMEGAASLEVRVRGGVVEYARFKVDEYKRFYTTAMQGKPIAALPQMLARICGTCSNAHLMASIESCEHALDIKASEQTMLLRHLTMYGLNIRDHALHLYLFVMPDLFSKDSFLDFEDKDPQQHQMLHDAFDIKAAGNFLQTVIAGRSVHAMHPTIGGYMHFPEKKEIEEAIQKFEAVRPAVLRLIRVFENGPFHFDRRTHFMALVPEGHFGFIDGKILCDDGCEPIEESAFAGHLEHVVLPYSQASGYRHSGKAFMVGALARVNVAKDKLHADTKKDAASALERFPSTDIYDNNLAQAIEILHSLDHSIEILRGNEFKKEPVIKKTPREAVGIGVVEAPRGLLYHRVELGSGGIVKRGEVVVPTGQNQVNMQEDMKRLVQELLDEKSKEEITYELEKLIRAYDPCLSCAAHFLRIKWDQA